MNEETSCIIRPRWWRVRRLWLVRRQMDHHEGVARVSWSSVLYVLPALACPLMMIGCIKGMAGGKGKAQAAPADPLQRRAYLEQELARLDAERRSAAVALASLHVPAGGAGSGVAAAPGDNAQLTADRPAIPVREGG